ncbi:uncharacterized protein [Typha angustifolia]|uniref:uncharacterized protein isoform X2 n=1 Tax=Typha angustifolia TaxID=59011 RepID=UPI003C30D520
MRGGGERARALLLHHSLRARLSNPFPPYQETYIRSHLLSSKSKNPSSSSIYSSSICSSSSSSSSTTTTSSTRNGLVGWYLRMIESRPVLTKSLTAGAIFTAADVSCQMITFGPDDPLDLIRTLRMAGYGMLISGPSLHLWFNFVSKILPKRDVITTFKKMFLGQAVYGPIINIVFFSLNAAVQGETIAEIIARLKRDLIPALKSGLMYWPVCDFVTFKFIPIRLQTNFPSSH